MVTLTSADNALKSLYLGVVADQLNTNINPLLSKIKQSTSDVWGKDIIKLAPWGINGGIGAGTEDGNLPIAAENKYAKFTSTLKNLYGTIEISDKAIRASENNVGAFVNLLNAEMEGLVKASTFNFGRMLFGDGSGKLGTITAVATDGTLTFDKVNNLMEGMVVDFYNAGNKTASVSNGRITEVDRLAKKVKVSTVNASSKANVAANDYIVVQGSFNNELTGLGAIFDATATSLYGVDKATNKWLTPYVKDLAGTTALNDTIIQEAIDYLSEVAGSEVDFILCSSKVKRAYQAYLATNSRNVDVLNLEGGCKAISFNGIPIISDRFVDDDKMYLLNSKDFTLHQLCDWQWLEAEDGRVIKQKANQPVYTATLVKYADLVCDRPSGQALLKGIKLN